MGAAVNSRTGGAGAPPVSQTGPTLLSWLFRLVALAIVDGIAIWLLYQMFSDGIWQLGLAIGIVTLLLNFIFLREDLYPLRWISPGLALLVVLVIYPVLFSVYTAFTNYGDGHLLTQPQVVRLLENRRFLAEGATLFNYTAYLSSDGTAYALYLEAPDGSEAYIAREGSLETATPGTIPDEIDGFLPLARADILRGGHTQKLVAVTFGDDETAFQVSDRQLGKAAEFQQRYTYLADEDAMRDNETGLVYRPVQGTYTAEDGSTLTPGYQVVVGTRNFERLLTNPAFREPFVLVFLWTIGFAILSVATTFAAGLLLAIALDDPDLPFQKLFRSLLLIPYAIPAFISVPIWVGLLNPQFGVITLFLQDIFGVTIPWFGHPTWAKAGIVLVNLWLGFPYMFLICTGALQALPTDIYEAADIDGANIFQRFRAITLPLLLITVGPLLVASFAFNFNNFVIIDLYNQGAPPMSGTPSPVGHTDILVSYTFRVAFSSGRGADLGYAAAITVAIFLILVVITWFQFRFTNMLEERSENV
jgi:arabinogalactan oligomer/maltooligosaccharide transport system permease protein